MKNKNATVFGRGENAMRDNADWKKQFGIFLKRFFDKYDLDYSCFAEKYHWSTSTIRYWFIGRSLPQRKGILNIKEYLSNNIPCNSRQDEQIYEEIKNFFAKQEAVSEYYNLRRLYPMMNQFSGEMLEVCYDIAKK